MQEVVARGWDPDAVEVGVAPPAVYLREVAAALAPSAAWVAGQDLHEDDTGAHTGDVGGPMLADVGATAVLVGHSERRHDCGESLERVAGKLSAALRHGLLPVLCVGETLEQRRAGRTDEVVREQLLTALEGHDDASVARLVVAYEPVWAIGTGERATVDMAAAAHRSIRATVAERFSPEFAGRLRIQYGGSVKPDNAAELFADPEIDGALVGGASLQAESFLAIVGAAASAPAADG